MTNKGCAKCGGVILADTEDWAEPLCYSHWHQHLMNNAIILLKNVVSIMNELQVKDE